MEAEGDPVLLFHRPNISTAGSNNSKATKQSTLNSNNNNASELDFVFRKRRDQINWRLLSSINVDRLMREVRRLYNTLLALTIQ